MSSDHLADELDLSTLGPGLRECIRTFMLVYEQETRLVAEKLTFPRVKGSERRYLEGELNGWHRARQTILTYPYKPPYVPGRGRPAHDSAQPQDGDGCSGSAIE